MPVSCKKKENKWVCTDSDGKVHGTHETEDKCKAQARAINANVKMSSVNILVEPKDLDVTFTGNELVYDKQHLYEGRFQQNSTQFDITEDALYHFAAETNRYIDSGNKVNLPLEHTVDPEKNRGHCFDFYVRRDSKNRLALFSKVQFRDEEAAKIARTASTSIFSPPKFTDGSGNEFVRPIRHVALTDYPVVNSLDGFEVIAASLVVPPLPKKGKDMAILDLAAKIDGLSLSENADDSIAERSIIDFIAALNGKVVELSETKKEYEKYVMENPKKADPVRISAAQKKMLADNRDMKLSKLVEANKITPAVKKSIRDIYCTESALTLVLSHDQDDSFDELVMALSENDAIKLLDKTQAQVADPTMMDPANNPLLAVAEESAKRKETEYASRYR